MAVSIPGSIEQVTPAWLGDVLKAELQAISPTQIGQGVGLLGDIYRVNITVRDQQAGLPDSVVVKLPSSFEDNRAQAVALGMFDAEVRFYNELAAQAPVGIPKVYLAAVAPGGSEFVIVMEDLSHLSMVDQRLGMSAAQARAAVEVLAGIHAAWWNSVETPAMEWIPTMTGPRIEFVDQLLTQILPVFEANCSRHLPEGGLEIYQRFAGNYLKLTRMMADRSPWTLVHQDCRVENMMFGPEGSGEVVVLDWQGIGRGPAAYDLAYILGGSMDTALRREQEQDLVQAYHQRLQDHGVTDYSADQLWRDYRHAHLLGGLATSMVTGGSLDLSNDRGIELVATMSSRHAAAALDHGGLALLSSI